MSKYAILIRKLQKNKTKNSNSTGSSAGNVCVKYVYTMKPRFSKRFRQSNLDFQN